MAIQSDNQATAAHVSPKHVKQGVAKRKKKKKSLISVTVSGKTSCNACVMTKNNAIIITSY